MPHGQLNRSRGYWANLYRMVERLGFDPNPHKIEWNKRNETKVFLRKKPRITTRRWKGYERLDRLEVTVRQYRDGQRLPANGRFIDANGRQRFTYDFQENRGTYNYMQNYDLRYTDFTVPPLEPRRLNFEEDILTNDENDEVVAKKN